MHSEPFRPRHHLTAPAGWMNDPNGLIKHGDDWHVFYQHDPASTKHGPMHWGHAVTRDFVTWHHLPVALAPQNGWTCFSGSAIETPSGDVKLFYTDHMRTPNGQERQHQSLVHADLAAGTFRREQVNPVVRSDGPGVFRDPKVIWHAASARWVMLITVGQEIRFYSSPDLGQWRFESQFGLGHGFHSAAPWECPDLVLLDAPDGVSAWVLFVGTSDPSPGRGTATQYFAGSFDGQRFTNANPPDLVLWADEGRDFYASQTFFRRDGGVPVMLGWASNWDYALVTPTHSFRGAMSFPRELTLNQTPQGLRLIQTLPQPLRDALPEMTASTGGGAVYRMAFTLDPEQGLFLFGADKPQLSRSPDGRKLVITRNEGWAVTTQSFCTDHHITIGSGPLWGEVYVDHGITEISLLDGRIWITQLHFPGDLTAAPKVDRVPLSDGGGM